MTGNEDQMAGAGAQHAAGRGGGAGGGTAQVDGEDLVPGRLVEPGQRGVTDQAGIANEKGRRMGAEKPTDRRGIGHVELAAAGREDRMAGGREGAGDGLPQPAFASGDHHGSAHGGDDGPPAPPRQERRSLAGTDDRADDDRVFLVLGDGAGLFQQHFE